MNVLIRRFFNEGAGRLVAVMVLAAGLTSAQAVPTLLSTTPENGAINVPIGSSVTFVFSEPMAQVATSASFFYFTPTDFIFLDATGEWSGDNTVLTYTPDSLWPTNALVYWGLGGENTNGVALQGDPSGAFMTVGGSEHLGYGTNATTIFAVGKMHSYIQNSSAAPVADPDIPFSFNADASMASNRVATLVQLILPDNSVSNMTLTVGHPESYFLIYGYTNSATMEGSWPNSTYTETVYSNATPTLSGSINLSASLVQPPAPHITNYLSAQAVDPSNAFTLGWDAFAGGTASDYIFVQVGADFVTPSPWMPGALPGTAKTVVVPAGVLGTNKTYGGSVTFYHLIGTSNATYSTFAYRASSTTFSFVTTGGILVSTSLSISNAVKAAGSFSFDVNSAPGQSYAIDCTSNLLSTTWQTWLFTNAPLGHLHFTDARANTNRAFYYRARKTP